MSLLRINLVKPLMITSALALVIVGASFLVTPLVFGHPELQMFSIPNGAILSLAQVPGKVTLTFSEGLDTKRSAVYIVKAGEDILVDRGDLITNDRTMAISLNALQTGVYQIHWIAISADDAGYRDGLVTFAVTAS
jgi:methionine-rich copper-binding protein CopC